MCLYFDFFHGVWLTGERNELMKKEIIETAKTIEAAVASACEKLGVSEDDVNIEVLEQPNKGFFKRTPAKVRVYVEYNKVEYAQEFLLGMMRSMGADGVHIEVNENESGAVLNLAGEDLGFIIGRHGDTLDAIQYITNLVVNQLEGDYYRITLDCGNFREKREKSLEILAAKLSKQVLRNGRSVTLEPMNPYERRIIHSAIQLVEGVTSASVGSEPNRCVVISSLNPKSSPRKKYDNKRGGKSQGSRNSGGRGGYSNNNSRPRSDSDSGNHGDGQKRSRPEDHKERSGEAKAEHISDREIGSALYGKIDLD